jgi:hypothetical protein
VTQLLAVTILLFKVQFGLTVALRFTGLTNLLYEVALPQKYEQPVPCLLQMSPCGAYRREKRG